MAERKVIDITSVAPTCGHCHWIQKEESSDDYGECYFSPPTARINEEGSVDVCRPFVEVNERACAMFTGRH